MRHVIKGQEPQIVSDWKALQNEDWKPTYRGLPNPEKRQLHLALLREQGFTCSYCGREIEAAESHIEHFRPRSGYTELELEYENLFASCMRELHPGDPAVCGHLKQEEFDETTFLSPLMPSIERRFSYTLAGDVLPRDDSARTMIDVLGLNKSFLSSRRSEALQSVFDPEFLESATQAELRKIAVDFRMINEDGKLLSFFHAVARFAEDLGEQRPADHLPEPSREAARPRSWRDRLHNILGLGTRNPDLPI